MYHMRYKIPERVKAFPTPLCSCSLKSHKYDAYDKVQIRSFPLPPLALAPQNKPQGSAPTRLK